MKNLKLFSVILMLFVGIGQVWATDPTISWDFKTLQTTSGTQSGITWETGKTGSANATACNGTNGLVLYGVTSGGGYFQTTSAISGTITNVNIVSANKKNTPKYTVYCSANGSDWTEIATDQTAGTKDHAVTGSYTYVKVANTTAATAQLGVASITVTYTPSGGGSTPSLSVDPASLTFDAVGVGDGAPGTKTFNITGSNLTSALTVTSSNTSLYTVSVTSGNLTPDEGAVSATVTVTPQSAITGSTGTKSATVTVSGGGLEEDVEVALSTEVKEKHNIVFNTNGVATIPSVPVVEGATYNISQEANPGESCEYKTFVGWTSADEIADASIKPALVNSVTMSTADVNLYAVYSKTEGGGGGGPSGSVVITPETENFPTAYGSANTFTEYTLEGYKFKIQQGYINGGKLQWRAAGNSSGTGIIYNTQTYPAKIASVVLVYSGDNNKNFTLKVGSSENPTEGTEITPSADGDTYTFDCSSANADYFVLTNGSGAGYLASITVNYSSGGGTTTYSLDANCCDPLGAIGGTITWEASGNDLVASGWSATTGGYETGYLVKLYNSDKSSVITSANTGSKDTKTHTFTTPGAGTYWASVTPTYSGAGTYCAEGTEVFSVASVELSGKVVVTFKMNGGTGTDNQTQEVTPNTNTALTSIAALGYTAPSCKQFGGWATTAEGEAVYDDEDEINVSEATNLFAVWNTQSFAVTDGTIDASVSSYSYAANIDCGSDLTITCAAAAAYKGNPTVTATGTHGAISVVSATEVTIANVQSAIAVSIAYETAKTSYTIEWNMDGSALSGEDLGGAPTSILEGNTISTFPTVANNTLACTNMFMGWSRKNYNTVPKGTDAEGYDDIFTDNAGTISQNEVFYAVFATSGAPAAAGYSLSNAVPADGDQVIIARLVSGTYYAMENAAGNSVATSALTVSAGAVSEPADGVIWDVAEATNGVYLRPKGATGSSLHINNSALKVANGDTNGDLVFSANGNGSFKVARAANDRWIGASGENGVSYTSNESSAAELYVFKYGAGGATYSGYVTKCAAVATPTFSPAGGTYTAAQNVELSCATEGEVTIKYTTDGTEPSKTVGETYGEAIAVNQSMTIKAIAIKDEDVSELATAAYVLQVPTPTISGATAFLENSEVTITCEGADAIYYTTNGDDPTNESTPYTAPFTVDATTTIKAIAVKENWENSEIASQTFTKLEVINVETALGLTSPANGKNVVGVITDITEVNTGYHNATYTISDVADGVATHSMLVYRGRYLNNTDFTATDQIYVGARVIVYGNVTEHSSINQLAQGNYLLSIEAPAVAAPTFTPDGGGFVVTTDVAISCATDGSEIYYTLDESNPTKSSTHYTEPVTITENKTFKAIAYVGDESSFVVTKTFTLTDPQTVEAAYDALDTEDPINNVAVEGIVYQVDVINGYATYWISDDGTEAAKVLEVYQGKSFDGANFAANGIRVGDKVIVFGNLTIYSTTKEFAAGSRLLSLERKTVTTVTVTGTPSKTSYKVGDAFDPTGLTVTLTYSDDSEATVAVADCSWEKDPATFSETGTDKSVSVKATYDEVQSAAFVVSGLTVTETPNFNLADHEWIKVTSASKLIAGRYYVIASEEKGKVTNRTITSGYLGEETAVFADGVIAYNGFGSSKSADQSNASIFELGGTTDAWTLTEVVNGKLLTGATTANLAWDGATNTTWAITIDGGDAIIGASDGNYIRHNYGSTRFKPYSGTQNAMKVPQLYMWAELSHSVTFDANGGVAESVPGIERTDEGKIIIPATEPTHSDVAKAFAGWYKDGAPSTLYNAGDEFATNEDVTLYAKWNTVPTYTVSYSANGGTGAAPAEPVTVKAGTTITVVENTGYTNPGKTFDGWLVTYNNGTEQTIDLDENSQFSMPAYNVVIKATWAEESNQKWALVTAASQLVAGAKYIIAAAGYDYAMAGQKTNNRDATAVVKRNEGAQLKGTASMQVITLEGTTGAWEFNTGAGYLYAAASGSNHLKTQETNDINGKWTITISEGVASIVASGSSNRNVMQFNNGSSKLFSCYSSASEKAVALYKEIPMTEITTNDMDQDDVPDGGDMTIKEDKTWTVSSAKEVGDVYMEEGAVIANSAAVTANDLYFKTKAGKSNQIHEASQLNVIGDLYYDVQLCSGSLDADYWYIIAVPFDVNINDGISLADGTPMTNGVDYEVWIFDPQKRAQSQANGWKRANGKMEAGRAYLIGFNPGMPNTVRLKAAPGWKDNLFSDTSIPVESTTTGEVGRYDNWNGIANPTMKYIGINTDVQVFNNNTHQFDPEPYDKDDYNYVVGTPFFVQATSASVDIEDADNAQFRAPKRDALEVEKYSNCVRIARAEAETYDNQIIVRASEEATSDYQAGHDMLTLNNTTSKTSALLWTENYGGLRLAIEEAPLVNNSAAYTLGIYAPADGDYSISADQDDASIYLTYEGRVIWDLTVAPYTLSLTKGNTAGYGLRIIAAPRATTDIDNIYDNASGVQKIMLNNSIFILRGEQMYDATGRMIK